MQAGLTRIIAGILLAGASHTFAELSIDELIDQIALRQESVTSVERITQLHITYTMGEDEDTMVQDSVLRFERPNKLHLHDDQMLLISDGEKLSILFPDIKYFIQYAVDNSLGYTLEKHDEFLASAFLPDVAALISATPHAVLRDFADDMTITVLPEEVRNERPTWVLRILLEDEAYGMEDALNVWIDQESGLLVDMEAAIDLTSLQQEHPMAGMPERITIAYKTVALKINEAIAPEAFMADTEDYTQVASFDALIEVMQQQEFPVAEDLIGQPAEDFELSLLDGNTFRLSNHKGKVVLIDFWATWCPPCAESLPYLQGMYEDLLGDDIVFVGVSVDDVRQERRVRGMLKELNVTYPVGIDSDESIARTYQAYTIPTSILVDREGLIHTQKSGFSPRAMLELEESIKALLE